MGGEVTRDEFEALKIRVTVMENAVNQVFQEIALLRQELNKLTESVDKVDERVESAVKEIKAQADLHQASIMSVLLAPRRG
ncbi:MAG: hypothetical protein JNM17_23615 [Archangium sp.]|nr:hypothetical protein [Archangium sp.]